MEETDVLMQCGYCKNKAKLIVRARHVRDLKNKDGDCFVTTWRLLECPVCSNLNLSETYVESYSEESKWEGDAEDVEYGEQIIYPVPKNEKNLELLPEPVKQVYKSALKVKYVPNAFAVQIGRTLEVVCKYENAQGRDLKDKLDYLANASRIPPTLVLMAHQLRLLRNFGAHADDYIEVETSDVPIIEEFVDAILEYLYVAQDKVNRLQENLKFRKDLKKEFIDLSEEPF